MNIEMHVHSKYSDDCRTEIENIIEQCRKRNIDAVCITDHDVSAWQAEEIGRKEGFPVFVGMEYSSADGHLLVYGVTDDSFLRTKHKPMQDIIDEVNAQGGAAIPAHPYAGRYKRSLGDKILTLQGLTAIEGHNRKLSPEDNLLAQKAATIMALPIIGGSDAHFSSNLGKVFTYFENDVASMQQLVHELKHGVYRPVILTSKGVPYGDAK